MQDQKNTLFNYTTCCNNNGETNKSNNKERLNQTNLINTKFMVPTFIEKLVNRNHLIERLNKTSSKKLSLVCAPAGFGKTTIVSSWVASQKDKIKATWVSLDDEDNNIKRFWMYFIASLDKLYPGTFYSQLSMLVSLETSCVKLVLDSFINEISQLSNPLTIVLDDYHFITQDNIHKSFSYFLTYIPQNLHIVIITRENPPFPIARMRIRGELLEIRTEDLRFSFDEVRYFLKYIMNIDLTDEYVKILEERSEGWAAALQIAALSLEKECDTSRFILNFDGTNCHMLEYLAEEIISKQPAYIQDFLIKTSVLHTLNKSLCNFVTKRSNSQEILEELQRKNLFILSLDNNKNNFRYHHLFADFLREKFKKMPTEAMSILCYRASLWYEENDFLEEAIDYSIISKTYLNTFRLIENHSEELMTEGKFSYLTYLIETLPLDIVRTKPYICVTYALALAITGKLDEKESYLLNKGINLEDKIFGDYGWEIAAVRSTVALSKGNTDAIIKYSDMVKERLSSTKLACGVVFKNLGKAYLLIGDFEKADKYLKECLAVGKEHNNIHIMISYYTNAIQINKIKGHLKEALKLCYDAIDLLKNNCRENSLIANLIYFDLGSVYYEMNELHLANEYLVKSINLSQIRHDVYTLLRGYGLLAKIFITKREIKEAHTLIEKIYRLPVNDVHRSSLLQTIPDIVRGLVLLQNLDMAKKIMVKYNVVAQKEMGYLQDSNQIALADLLIASGELKEGKEILNTMHDILRDSDRKDSLIKVLILLSIACKLEGNEGEALLRLRQALELAYEGGYIRVFVDYGKVLANLLCELLREENKISNSSSHIIDYILKLLPYFDYTDYIFNIEEDTFIEPLTQREVEILKHISGGLRNDQIAEMLFVSKSTIKKHINNIYRKLSIENRHQAIAISKKFNLL